MSSHRPDNSDIGGGDTLKTLTKDNSNEKVHYLANSKITREASPLRRSGSPTPSNMSAPPRSGYRRKAVRSTLSSRESSPNRVHSTGGRPSQLQNSSLSSSQGPTEGPLPSPRTQRPTSNAPQWPASPRLGTGSKSAQRSPALSPRHKNEQPSAGTFTPSALQIRAETPSKNIAEDSESAEPTPSGMRTPTRSTSTPALETVVESSLPSTPAIGASRVLAEKVAAVQAMNQETIHESTDGDNGDTTGGESTTPTASRSLASRASSIAGSVAENESDAGGYRSEGPWNNGYTSASNAGPSTNQRVFTRRPTLVNTLSQHMDTSRNMTVETETVTSTIQLGGGAGNTGASIRSKKSNETIRAPRKEKKRKPAAISTTNPTSTKAEIFGAVVASAVDANSSDSDETFVYESNPPDHRPTGRPHHSRTPSVSSLHGGPDPRGRNVPPHDQQGPPVTRVRMKFVPHHSSNTSQYGDNDGGGPGPGSYGTVNGQSRTRPDSTRNNGSTSRHGQNNSGQPSIIADESPFISKQKASQPLRNAQLGHLPPRPLGSPTTRSPHNRNGMAGNGNNHGYKKNSRVMSPPYASSSYGSPYGAEEEGDDERTSLLTQHYPRNNRVRRSRHASGSLLQQEHNEHRRRSWLGRFAGCIITVATIILVVTGTIGFMFATSKPLQDVKVLDMTDILVSQQEIMLDLIVQALNPNMIGVTVQSMDVNMFAKSSYVRDDKDKDKDGGGDKDKDKDKNPGEGTEGGLFLGSVALARKNGEWEVLEHGKTQHDQSHLLEEKEPGGKLRTAPSSTTRHREQTWQKNSAIFPPKKGVDEGTDPDPNLPDQEDRQTMLLGRIYQLDSPLSFDASPFYNYPSISKAGLRLAKPGNRTEKGGTERWERVILHPFELIVRGILKYQLPLSGRMRTTSISASVVVNPADDNMDLPVEED